MKAVFSESVISETVFSSDTDRPSPPVTNSLITGPLITFPAGGGR
jgi:hypothetical protein